MKALTIWQPWASLIMIGAKPYEFRRWDFQERGISAGLRIVIHAGARPIKPVEIADLIKRCQAGTGETSLIAEKALPLLRRIAVAHKCRGVVPLSVALGTAILGMPRNVNRLFKTPDSDRVDHHMYGWPLTNIRTFDELVEVRGMQGFWNYPFKVAA